MIPEVISGLLKKYNLNIKDFAKIAYPGLYVREHGAIAKRLGVEPSQIQDILLDKIGDTGSASPLMIMAAALEDASPGDKILVASFGNGGDALFFKGTEKINRVGDRA